MLLEVEDDGRVHLGLQECEEDVSNCQSLISLAEVQFPVDQDERTERKWSLQGEGASIHQRRE